MFKSFRLPPCRRAPPFRRVSPRRTLFTLEAFTEGFLDLAISLPYPASFPPYSCTIILVAATSRLLFTVPVSVWAKRREWRMEELVVPQLEKSKPEIYTKVIQQMQKEQVRGTRESIKQEHAKRSAAQLRTLQKELCATYRCKPWPTALAPLASQLPLFIGITYVLRHLSADPTPFDSESFMSLANLANPDPTFALPVVLGIITLVNVESYKWFQTPTQIAQEQNTQSLTSKRRREGRIIVPWREIFRTGMRLATPVRMIVAAMMPGSVVLYWISSASFGLVQNWFFDWWHRRRTWNLALDSMPAPVPSSPKPNPKLKS